MKTFLMKIFLVIASALCMLEGIFFIAIGMGRLSPDQLTSLYTQLLALPKVLSSIQGFGLFFVLLGFILLAISSHTRPAPKVIRVEKDGRTLDVPQETIRSFIKQIMAENPRMSDYSVEFETKDKTLGLVITSSFNGVTSLHQELAKVEEIIRSEVETVFAWKGYSVTFHTRGVSVNPEKKYFPGSKPAAKPPAAPVAAASDASATEEPKEGPAAESQELQVEGQDEQLTETQLDDLLQEKGSSSPESNETEEKPIGHPQKKSIFTKMLWGG